MDTPGKLFIVSAPSGAGKSTLVAAIVDRYKDVFDLMRIVTYTSRQPRGSEVTGRDYHYIPESEFKDKIEQGFFLEWSCGLGHYYGTQKAIIEDLKQGRSGILVIDRSGAQQIVKTISDAVLIWIKVSQISILEERLLKRGTETKEQIQRRLERAAQEIAEEAEKKMYKHHVLNDVLQNAFEELENIIVSSLK